ncbi:uncharacterized protein LOC126370212 isoform X1 [Pectinophora gossypiella]|uniref:uncharacterized protein LOC126370212 isoform X1 n=1 Tax=Pectinophora gossypiella TaxID=13191 RepID=UPI00214DFCFA|nr:uncharacterized protein LOC126370212 isoform X1 [Pectinophora gossypiella]
MRLHDENRHLKSLFSRSDHTEPSTFPIVGIRRENVPNDLSSVWTSQRTSGICKDHELDCPRTQTKRSKDCGLLRRLSAHAQRLSNSREPSRVCLKILRENGMASKLRKIFGNTNQGVGIFGNHLEHGQEPEGTRCPKNRTIIEKLKRANQNRSLELARCESNTRQAKLCVVCSASGTFTLQNPAQSVQPPTQEQTAYEVPDPRSCPARVRMVVGERSPGNTDLLSFSDNVHNNGCGRQGLGSNSKWPKVLGLLVSESTKVAQQPKRTLDGIRSSKTAGIGSKRTISDFTDGQPYERGLHNETRGYEIPNSSSNNGENSKPLSELTMSLNSPLHTRSVQWDSRRSIEGKGSTGVASPRSSSRNDLPDSRSARDRLICIGEVCGGTSLCQRRRCRHGQPVYRRIQQDVAVQVGLDFSTTCVNSSSSSAPEVMQRSVPPGNPNMEQGVLGTGATEESARTPVQNPKPSILPSRSADQPTSPGDRPTEFGGMEGSGWIDHVNGWSEREVHLLKSAWRSSSLKTYRAVWAKWRNWALLNNVTVSNPSPQSLAKYLCFLFNQEKYAPRTVALHKSVVSTFSNPSQSETLSSHLLVRQVLKGIFSENPPKPKSLSWRIDDLLNFLKDYSFDEYSIFGVSRHTCVLLLLASGRRVHDLTLLSIGENSFEDNGEEIIFWPKFGSKTDTPSHRQSGWLLKSSEDQIQRLNIVFWVKRLISVTNTRRVSKNIESLFITTRGAVKSASRSIIAGWIRTLFKEAGISASAGSFRAAVSSDMWSSNLFNIEEVLKRGNWRSRNTFINYYFKEVPKQPRVVSNALVDSFIAV